MLDFLAKLITTIQRYNDFSETNKKKAYYLIYIIKLSNVISIRYVIRYKETRLSKVKDHLSKKIILSISTLIYQKTQVNDARKMYYNGQFTHSITSLMKKITKKREANKEMIKKKSR